MRVSGITIPDEKRLEFGLTAIYGIGRSRARTILIDLGIDPMMKTSELSEEDEGKIREKIETLRIEGDLRRDVSGSIQRLKDIKAYRGTRHVRRLPARGQRTKTNNRTVRGNKRVTMGSGKKKVEKK